jgi:hypothetical protein
VFLEMPNNLWEDLRNDIDGSNSSIPKV